MYHLIRREIDLGNVFIRSYIDSASFTSPLRQVELLGTERGMFKQQIDYDVVAEENRLIPALFSRVKAPGFDFEQKVKLYAKYHA
jgi:hypothetical protein